MKPTRRLDRRSFLSRVAGGGGLVLLGGAAAAGQLNDNDSGTTADRNAAPGTRGKPTGCTDSDAGRNGDPANRGRRCTPARRQADSDSGASSDAPSHPPRPVVTDRDSGFNADPVGRGRGPARACADAGSGANGDPAGRGRNC